MKASIRNKNKKGLSLITPKVGIENSKKNEQTHPDREDNTELNEIIGVYNSVYKEKKMEIA